MLGLLLDPQNFVDNFNLQLSTQMGTRKWRWGAKIERLLREIQVDTFYKCSDIRNKLVIFFVWMLFSVATCHGNAESFIFTLLGRVDVWFSVLYKYTRKCLYCRGKVWPGDLNVNNTIHITCCFHILRAVKLIVLDKIRYSLLRYLFKPFFNRYNIYTNRSNINFTHLKSTPMW